MNWEREDTIALARESCSHCGGIGLRAVRKGERNPCNCVLRAIFRACYARFHHCVTKEKHISRVTLAKLNGKEARFVYGRPDEEYIADFCLVSRRYLSSFEYKVFSYHLLLGADWRMCCRRLQIDRGTFFHTVYRIQQRLGRVFRELKPYGLFPLDEYFDHKIERRAPVIPIRPGQGTQPEPVRPPLRKIA